MRSRGRPRGSGVIAPRERLERRLVRRDNGCLEWTGSTNGGGYGHIWVDGKCVGTHCLAWTLVNGPIPDGLLIRHYVCDNPPCCDVEHLRLGTDANNMADKTTKGRHRNGRSERTHCPQKHEYDEANTYVAPGGKRRACRICGRAKNARYRLRQRELEVVGK